MPIRGTRTLLSTLPAATGVALAIALLGSGATRAQPAAPPSNVEATWGEGSRLVHQGVLALTTADKALSDAARRGVEATGRRATASASAQRAADEFRRLSSATPTSTDASEAQRWAGVVQAAAARWVGFQTQEREATRDLNAAIQQNSAAQKAAEAAMAQIDRGRRMIGDPQPVGGEPPPATPAPAAAR